MLSTTKLVQGIVLPDVIRIQQRIPDDALKDVKEAAGKALSESAMTPRIKKGSKIAVAVGSRGIMNLAVLVRASVDWLRGAGAEPFIVPAMGSHGQATAEGQKALLADLGVTEESVGCPIHSCMDVVELGTLPNKLSVYIDRVANEADGIFVINRIKPHTSFRGKHESGIVKMVTIGLGKQIGADSCHSFSFAAMAENLINMAEVSLSRAKFIGALACVENANDHTCLVEAVPIEHFVERDAALLEFARTKMPSLPFDRLDVLIIDEMGKNIAGTGMDYNVIGRYPIAHMSGGPDITRIAVLDLTDASHGNAMGMGMANFITWRIRDKLDFETIYTNSITATPTAGAYMPIALSCDRDAIKAAVKTACVRNQNELRFARIQNTLQTKNLLVSPHLLEEALAKGCLAIGEPQPLAFSESGELLDRGIW